MKNGSCRFTSGSTPTLISCRWSPLACPCLSSHVWSISVNAFVSYIAHRQNERSHSLVTLAFRRRIQILLLTYLYNSTNLGRVIGTSETRRSASKCSHFQTRPSFDLAAMNISNGSRVTNTQTDTTENIPPRYTTQGRIQDFGLGGALAGVWGGSPPAGSRGRAPMVVWGGGCYVMRLKKPLMLRKKQVDTD